MPRKAIPVSARLATAWALVALLPPAVAQHTVADPRDIRTGSPIPDEGYCDQPYVVVTADGAWLATLTTGPGREGDKGQHVVSTRSTDRGRTWTGLVDIEPSDGPEASWVVPLITPTGRVYAFYTYNGDNVRQLRGKPIRADTIGHYVYKFSDDGGRSWSEERYRLPLRRTACDRGNDWSGRVQIFWGIDKPMVTDSSAMFAFTKLGKYMLEQGEGWLFRSDNILSETDPAGIRWELLPDGDRGLRGERFGSVQEEHNVVALGDGSLYCVWRTTLGHPCSAYSRDGGHTWTKPEPMTYSPGGRIVKTPRACPMLWRTAGGKFLFWYHNHSSKSYQGRNPVWISGGVERDGYVHWSEPEILLYDRDPAGRMSYPDLIEEDGRFWVTETNKTIARVHEVDPTLLEGLWRQSEAKRVSRDALLVDAGPEQLASGPIDIPGPLNLTRSGGMTVEVWLRNGSLAAGQVLLDCRTADGRGFLLETTDTGGLRLQLADGRATAAWDSDPGQLRPGQLHHVVAIVDAAPRIVSFIVDGRFCDGGPARDYGWGRYPEDLGDVAGSGKLRVGTPASTGLQRVRLYARYLRTSEAVASFRAGP